MKQRQQEDENSRDGFETLKIFLMAVENELADLFLNCIFICPTLDLPQFSQSNLSEIGMYVIYSTEFNIIFNSVQTNSLFCAFNVNVIVSGSKVKLS